METFVRIIRNLLLGILTAWLLVIAVEDQNIAAAIPGGLLLGIVIVNLTKVNRR